MILKAPLKNIAPFPPIAPNGTETYISQKFGNVWIADRDMVINEIKIKKGQNVYKVAFGMNCHNGVDIAAPLGTPIYAPHDGWIVEQVGKPTGFGLRITMRVESDGKFYMGIYGHQQRFEAPNQWEYGWYDKNHPVKKGDLIGYVNSTGFSTGNHCHWGWYEMTANGATINLQNGYGGAIDPMPFVKDNVMEWYKIEGEQTLVVKNFDGKYYLLATDPALYPYVAKIFGLEGHQFNAIPKAEVYANLGGVAQAGITFVGK